MPIFRVHGQNLRGERVSVDVRCASESIARNTANQHDLVNTTSVEIVDESDAVDVVRPSKPPPRRALPADFDWQRVWTIAAGVFFGLLAWMIFASAVGLVLMGLSR